ncbi:hypothetical protein BJ085DRAFT_30022 [Dimargaris cristalligena]|uniref:Uncharacterized protein n=1 Tax=Dimargaris cristalligena TaxID=215637 RepID=A0A4P9ZZS9_9FUNG|nr:hypothetical protein BJ085DRAFT_30022 [Dimargaris cristalligena]|eukprot:RKP38462.1 hypothetical protein BJ085DRAFT_30022 [Dimargaris cristalligena]
MAPIEAWDVLLYKIDKRWAQSYQECVQSLASKTAPPHPTTLKRGGRYHAFLKDNRLNRLVTQNRRVLVAVGQLVPEDLQAYFPLLVNLTPTTAVDLMNLHLQMWSMEMGETVTSSGTLNLVALSGKLPLSLYLREAMTRIIFGVLWYLCRLRDWQTVQGIFQVISGTLQQYLTDGRNYNSLLTYFVHDFAQMAVTMAALDDQREIVLEVDHLIAQYDTSLTAARALTFRQKHANLIDELRARRLNRAANYLVQIWPESQDAGDITQDDILDPIYFLNEQFQHLTPDGDLLQAVPVAVLEHPTALQYAEYSGYVREPLEQYQSMKKYGSDGDGQVFIHVIQFFIYFRVTNVVTSPSVLVLVWLYS